MSSIDRDEAKGLLDEVATIQSATRARLHANGWQWLVVWCVTFFGAALTGLVPGWQEFADVYWAFATPIALVLTAFISWKVEAGSPVRQRSWPYWAIGLALTVSMTAVGILLPESVIVVLVWVVLGLGFAGFAWLEKVTPAAWLLAGMAVLSGVLGLVVDDTFELYPALGLAFSGALAGIITGLRMQAQR
jgi:hypothetical protein